MLTVDGIGVRYGGVRAVDGVSFTVDPGQVVAVLGPNGAGKTSTLAAISGLVPHDGTVSVDGEPVTSPHEARRRGVVHMPEGRGLFRRLTVEQNVRLGAYGSEPDPRARQLVAGNLWPRRVETLSGGEQAMVAIARLVAGRPSYALLDEPSLGLAPAAVDTLFAQVERLRGDGTGIVLVEQYPQRALAVADRVITLERGRVIYAGDPQGLGAPEDIVAAYLEVSR